MNALDDDDEYRIEIMMAEYSKLVDAILSKQRLENAVDLGGSNGKKCIITFPQKLHLILKIAPHYGFDHIISWQPHGRCFQIRNRNLFFSAIASRIFETSKYTSFQRQLNLYNFQYIPIATSTRDRGSYFHKDFLRGCFHLCQTITRVRTSWAEKTKDPDFEAMPDFYSLPFCQDDGDVESAQPIAPESNKDPEDKAQVSPPGGPEMDNVLVKSPIHCMKRPLSTSLDDDDDRRKFPKSHQEVNSDVSAGLFYRTIAGLTIYINTELFTMDDFNEVMTI